MTSYEQIFERFLDKIEDVDLAKMDFEDRLMMLNHWFISAIAYVEADMLNMEHDLSDRDEESQAFNQDLTNAEIEVLSLYMVVAWYDSKINSLDHTLLFMGSKDEKYTSQRDHWKQTKEMQDFYRKRARKYFRNHSSRNNSYIKGETK